jgi:hypothetical protein
MKPLPQFTFCRTSDLHGVLPVHGKPVCQLEIDFLNDLPALQWFLAPAKVMCVLSVTAASMQCPGHITYSYINLKVSLLNPRHHSTEALFASVHLLFSQCFLTCFEGAD